MPRIQLVPLLAVLALAAPSAASAAFFAGDTVDGPNADVARVGGIDLARDGTGTVVYVKRVAGIEHVFAARMVDGVWQAPERLDPALALPSTEPVVAVANRGTAIVAFLNNGQLYTIVRRAADTAWPAPVALGDGSADTPSVDLSVNGVGYVVWTREGQDVRAAWLSRNARAFTPYDAPVDIVPDAEAGTGTGRPKVAASADGTAIAVWGEGGHAYARRLLREDGQSQFPQELGVPSFNGHAGGVADEPSVDIADDSSFAWATFRQQFDNGATTRVLARKLVGSVFDPPADVGGGGFGGEAATDPAVDVAGGGDPIAVFASDTATSHTPFGALSYFKVFPAPFGLSAPNTVPSVPAAAIGDTSQATVAWFDTDAGVPAVAARGFKFGKPADAEARLSDLSLGAVDTAGGLATAADRYGDAVVAFVQGIGSGRRLMVAVWDRPPVNLIQTTTFHWRDDTRPVGWARISEPWGDITWTVSVDGRVLGTTVGAKRSFPIQGRIGDGLHKWTLTATDRRGQSRTAGPRSLRIDSHGPGIRLTLHGKKKRGVALRFVVKATDHLSGVASVKVDFGDGSPPAFGADVRHAFASGTYDVRITATDHAGNRSVVQRRLAIR